MKNIFKKYDFILSDEQEEKFQLYYELLIEWNNKINLTAITEYKEVIEKHFIDSALLLQCGLFHEVCPKSVLDMGTGAGFPGIVLAILKPEIEFILVDSLNKRIEFLNLVIDKLGLSNVKTFHERAEEFGRNLNYRNKVDIVVSRAVAALPLLLEYCIPLVKTDGYFVSYKSTKYKDEIDKSNNAFTQLDCKMEQCYKFQVGENIENRNLLFIKKISDTNSKYPRKVGKPKKNPL